MRAPTITIVGGGPAASTAVATLRSMGFDGRLVMVEPDGDAPYERPPLSKGFLAGSVEQERLRLQPERWWEALDVEIRSSRVRRLSVRERTLFCEDGDRIGYDQALVATGGSPRRLPGMSGSKILTLRTVDDAVALRSFIGPGAHVVIAGAGFIGCEVAATARDRGARVTVIEPAGTVLGEAVGPAIGQVLSEAHRDRGVEFRFGDALADVRCGAEGVSVVTASGAKVAGDVLVVCVGLTPNVSFLDDTVAVDSGILVDGFCRASVPDVWAAGDVANHDHPQFGRMRIEHHDNALRQGAAVAANMLGAGTEYAAVPWVWSDQYEHNLQITGRPRSATREVVRGRLSDRNFVALYLDDTRIVGAVGLNRGREIIQARRMIERRGRLDPDLVADSERPLAKAALT